MKKAIGIIVNLLLIIGMLSGCSQVENQQAKMSQTERNKLHNFKQEVDKLFTDYYYNKFSGYVSISSHGVLIFEKGYGMADYEKSILNTAQTKFDMGSITKQFTAMGIMQLQEKGLLDVEDTIDKYIPDFPHGDKITIHHLLTHTSGLPLHPDKFDLDKYRPMNYEKNSAMNAESNKISLSFEPGISYQYSNTGYILLGYIIEEVSHKPIDVYFKENIFEPLGMKNTGYKDAKFHIENLAIGYYSVTREQAEPSYYDINFGPRGAGGLCSTVEDLHIWDRALYTNKLVSKQSVEKFFYPHTREYGYGWMIFGPKEYGHVGTASGYRSFILRQPDYEISIIILSNFQDAPIEKLSLDLQKLFKSDNEKK